MDKGRILNQIVYHQPENTQTPITTTPAYVAGVRAHAVLDDIVHML